MSSYVLPLLPIFFELLIRDVRVDTWTSAAITYTAAIGLASRNDAVMTAGWVAAAVLVFVFAGELFKELVGELVGNSIGRFPWVFSSTTAQVAMVIFAFLYIVERFVRHVMEARPFIEVQQ